MKSQINIENKEFQNWNKGKKIKAAIMALSAAPAPVATIPVVLSVPAIMSLFTGCPNNTTDEQDKVQREFKITFNHYQLLGGVLTPYPVTVTVIDETGGNTNLEEQGMVLKLEQAFETYAGWAKEGNASARDRGKEVFSRNLTIRVGSSGEFFEGFRAVNHNTVRTHIDFLLISNPEFPIVNYLSNIIAFGLYPLTAKANPLNNNVRMAEKRSVEDLCKDAMGRRDITKIVLRPVSVTII
jgi:hypothetical protein